MTRARREESSCGAEIVNLVNNSRFQGSKNPPMLRRMNVFVTGVLVAVVGFAGEDVAGHATLVQSLHDDHDRQLVIVEAVGHRLANEPQRLLPLGVALGL
jgi:hypothetical protein